MAWKAYLQGLTQPGYEGICYPAFCTGTSDKGPRDIAGLLVPRGASLGGASAATGEPTSRRPSAAAADRTTRPVDGPQSASAITESSGRRIARSFQCSKLARLDEAATGRFHAQAYQCDDIWLVSVVYQPDQ